MKKYEAPAITDLGSVASQTLGSTVINPVCKQTQIDDDASKGFGFAGPGTDPGCH